MFSHSTACSSTRGRYYGKCAGGFDVYKRPIIMLFGVTSLSPNLSCITTQAMLKGEGLGEAWMLELLGHGISQGLYKGQRGFKTATRLLKYELDKATTCRDS